MPAGEALIYCAGVNAMKYLPGVAPGYAPGYGTVVKTAERYNSASVVILAEVGEFVQEDDNLIVRLLDSQLYKILLPLYKSLTGYDCESGVLRLIDWFNNNVATYYPLAARADISGSGCRLILTATGGAKIVRVEPNVVSEWVVGDIGYGE